MIILSGPRFTGKESEGTGFSSSLLQETRNEKVEKTRIVKINTFSFKMV